MWGSSPPSRTHYALGSELPGALFMYERQSGASRSGVLRSSTRGLLLRDSHAGACLRGGRVPDVTLAWDVPLGKIGVAPTHATPWEVNSFFPRAALALPSESRGLNVSACCESPTPPTLRETLETRGHRTA